MCGSAASAAARVRQRRECGSGCVRLLTRWNSATVMPSMVGGVRFGLCTGPGGTGGIAPRLGRFGPPGTARHSAITQHACVCTVACVRRQMSVCARTDVCVCADACVRACVCRCARRAAPMYLPTWPQMVHFTPCTWQWPHTSQIGSRSRFGPLMAGGPLARRAAGERATLVGAAVCRRADPDDARR